ncbi:MAG TPA: NAD(P)-binding domain-containing protein [Ktedonobacteraceae bacterium]|nr:NAD(P)-binding domain-containing protein [Ktedonobacteraceae bacterium]
METYRIAVLGAGKVGGTLGKKWLAAGHEVTFGVRDPGSSRLQSLQSESGTPLVVRTLAQALENAEVVLFAISGASMKETIVRHAAQLDGKILIDAANNISSSHMNNVNSLAVFRAHTPHAAIYRAFNTYGWENFADPLYQGVPGDLFYCGPAGSSQTVVEQLISEVGLRPVRVGDADQADLVDSLLRFWFTLSHSQGTRHLALKLLTR